MHEYGPFCEMHENLIVKNVNFLYPLKQILHLFQLLRGRGAVKSEKHAFLCAVYIMCASQLAIINSNKVVRRYVSNLY